MLTYTGKKNIVLQVGKFTRSTLAAMTLSILLGGVSLAKKRRPMRWCRLISRRCF